jgi:hypothetical protein
VEAGGVNPVHPMPAYVMPALLERHGPGAEILEKRAQRRKLLCPEDDIMPC